MHIKKRLLFPVITLAAFLGGATLSSAQTAAPAPSPSAAPVTDATPSASPAAKKTSKKKTKKAEPATTETASPATDTSTDTSKPLAAQAPGGGPGMVWVNQKSKVYHKEDSRYYGRTKDGKYMTEDEAKAMGAHAAGAGGKKKTDKKS